MPTIPSLYCCGHCPAMFTRRIKFQVHERSHTGERPFVCDFEDCNKSYASLSHLKRHQGTHGKSFRCTICSANLISKTSLKKHLDFKHGQKKTYQCSYCNAQFNKHSWLQTHMFKHTGAFPYTCSEEGCGQGFMVPSKLKRHMKRHRGYPCTKPNCDQIFPKWSDLVKHTKQTHPVVHKCDVCEKLFSCATNLKKHQLVHSSERAVFACEVPNCPRFYTLKKNLAHHVKSFHGRRPFMCPREFCVRAFQTQELLDEHLKYHNKRKPRRKKKCKPTLAATLAGCVSKKSIKRRKRNSSGESAVEGCSDDPVTDQDTSTPLPSETVTRETTPSVTSEQSCEDLTENCKDDTMTTVTVLLVRNT